MAVIPAAASSAKKALPSGTMEYQVAVCRPPAEDTTLDN
jgi:hypothetical protein